MLTHDVLHYLATAEPKPLIISIHVRTDPRDPANTGSTPAWLIKLRNGLRVIAERFESGGDRDARLAFRSARKRIEQRLTGLTPAGRARSVAWMLEVGGDSDGNSELQF